MCGARHGRQYLGLRSDRWRGSRNATVQSPLRPIALHPRGAHRGKALVGGAHRGVAQLVARRLGITPSTMGHLLARLRIRFADRAAWSLSVVDRSAWRCLEGAADALPRSEAGAPMGPAWAWLRARRRSMQRPGVAPATGGRRQAMVICPATKSLDSARVAPCDAETSAIPRGLPDRHYAGPRPVAGYMTTAPSTYGRSATRDASG